MPTRTRPTIRCLTQDLDGDWGSVQHQRLVQDGYIRTFPQVHSLDHLLIRKSVEMFKVASDIEVARERISSVTELVLWKVKTGDWRGAVYEDAVGQAWLVAGGRRREGDHDDFYTALSDSVAGRGVEALLPTSRDKELLALEESIHDLEVLEGEVIALARRLLQEAWTSDDGIASGRFPPEPALATVEVMISKPTEHDADAEWALMVDVSPQDWSRPDLLNWCELVFLAAIFDREDKWGVPTYYKDGSHGFSFTVENGAEMRSIVDAQHQANSLGCMRPGDMVHHVPRTGLMASTINGEAVTALCGRSFVPRQDFENKEPCPSCAYWQEQLSFPDLQPPLPGR